MIYIVSDLIAIDFLLIDNTLTALYMAVAKPIISLECSRDILVSDREKNAVNDKNYRSNSKFRLARQPDLMLCDFELISSVVCQNVTGQSCQCHVTQFYCQMHVSVKTITSHVVFEHLQILRKLLQICVKDFC